MSKDNNQLQENYDDALFALLMDAYAQREGERLIAENERLQSDSSAAVPEDLDKRILRFIEKETSRHSRRITAKGLAHPLGRLLIAAVIVIALFTTAFALSPDFRAGTLNLLLEIDSVAASWQLHNDDDSSLSSLDTLPEVVVSWVPEGYEGSPPVFEGRLVQRIEYENGTGGLIEIRLYADDTMVYSFDIEDPEIYEEITIHGHPGVVVEKNGKARVSWADDETGIYVLIDSVSEDPDTLIKVAENISVIP